MKPQTKLAEAATAVITIIAHTPTNRLYGRNLSYLRKKIIRRPTRVLGKDDGYHDLCVKWDKLEEALASRTHAVERCIISQNGKPTSWMRVTWIDRHFHPNRYRIVKMKPDEIAVREGLRKAGKRIYAHAKAQVPADTGRFRLWKDNSP